MRLQHPEVRYEVTDHCNAHCIMCPREKHDRAHGIMNLGLYMDSIDEIVELGAQQVVLTGFGEPLLDTTLEAKVNYAHNLGLRTYIITNASALTPSRSMALMACGLDEMRVSFYGMHAESYEAVMRGLSYDRAVKNLVDFLEARRVCGSRCKVQLSYLVLPENEADVDAFREFWEPLVDYIEVWKPHNWSDGRDYRERRGIKRTCGRPAHGPLQIQWNGDVIPCCYDYNNATVLGNAFEQPIPDILRGGKYNALRKAHENGEFWLFPFCDNCDQLLEHADALVYTNRHDLPASEAVQLSNTDLWNLVKNAEFSG